MRLLVAKNMGFTPENYAALEQLGFQLVFPGGSEMKSYDMDFSSIEAVMCYRFFDFNDIRRFTSLRVVHLTSAGYDHMPLDYLRERGIRLYNARGVFSAPIAEFALWGVLELYKCGARFRGQREQRVWRHVLPLRELGGKAVCILGTGSIAGETARRFAAMGCTVTGLCRHPAPAPGFHRVLGMDRLDQVLPESDIVILALPLTEETRHLFDSRRFARMKPGAVFVNVARGPIAETEALLSALRDGPLSGAVLDVFETEPLPADSPFWTMDNVVLTPHNSFSGELNSQRMFRLLYGNLKAWLEEENTNTI